MCIFSMAAVGILVGAGSADTGAALNPLGNLVLEIRTDTAGSAVGLPVFVECALVNRGEGRSTFRWPPLAVKAEIAKDEGAFREVEWEECTTSREVTQAVLEPGQERNVPVIPVWLLRRRSIAVERQPVFAEAGTYRLRLTVVLKSGGSGSGEAESLVSNEVRIEVRDGGAETADFLKLVRSWVQEDCSTDAEGLRELVAYVQKHPASEYTCAAAFFILNYWCSRQTLREWAAELKGSERLSDLAQAVLARKGAAPGPMAGTAAYVLALQAYEKAAEVAGAERERLRAAGDGLVERFSERFPDSRWQDRLRSVRALSIETTASSGG
jgi:hypothetical protein